MTSANALAGKAKSAADELQALANDITNVLDTLPLATSSGPRDLLEQHARRAVAIAAALRVEASEPDPVVASLLLRAKQVVASTIAAAVVTLAVGALEEAGADGWRVLAASAHHLSDGDDEVDRESFAALLRDMRVAMGLAKRDVAEAAGVSPSTLFQWEAGLAKPSPSAFTRLIDRLRLPALAEKVLREAYER